MLDTDKLFRAVYPVYQEQEWKRSHAQFVEWMVAFVHSIYMRDYSPRYEGIGSPSAIPQVCK